MEGHGIVLGWLFDRMGSAARNGAENAGKVAKAAGDKVAHAISEAKTHASKQLFPQPAGASIEPCPKGRKADRVAERKAKLAASKERLKVMPPGRQRDALAQATERFERNNVAVERARLADDAYKVGQGDPPEGWERVGPEELKKLGGTEDLFPQLAKDFRPELHKDGYYAELYKSKSSVFGEERYVLAFRGTQGKKDGATDVVQAFGGETDHYRRAIKTAQALQRVLKGKFDITGHSMGGGMAAAAGIIAEVPAVTIDPAGVHPATLERVGKGYSRSSADRYVQNYVAEGEILDAVQNAKTQRGILAGTAVVSSAVGASLTVAGHRAMLENGTVTFGAAGPVYKVPVYKNAEDINNGKAQVGMSYGVVGRIANTIEPFHKVKLHDPLYVIAGIEQQKADDISKIEHTLH